MIFNTLYIATDSENINWLSYIFEEFSRLNKIQFSFVIGAPDDAGDYLGVLYYTRYFVKGVNIPNRSHIRPNGTIQWISEGIFIIESTCDTDNRFACSYDLLWNAFIFLSRFEEYEYETAGGNIGSYRCKHPRKDKSTFDIPIVNFLFDELEKIIARFFPKLAFGGRQKPVIELSHDVDYIEKTVQIKLKQLAFNGYNTLNAITNPSMFFQVLWKTLKFIGSRPSYWCFDYWQELEKSHNTRSIFYFYAKANKQNLMSRLIDPSYDITTNTRLQKKIIQLIEEGFEIGLHGSYLSATNDTQLLREKELLESVTNHDVIKVRQHWLRYQECSTPVLHNRYFQFDSTLGWNDHMGFRSGCACRYRPYNHQRQKPFQFMVTPQIIMDANIFDYGIDRVEYLSVKALSLIQSLKQFKSSHVSVSWHQRVACQDYKWHGLYEKLLKTCSEYL